MNKTLKINGLNCASCADKIEIKLRDVPWIENANLNFTMGNLSIDVNDQKKYSIPMLQKLIDEIEDGVSIHENDNTDDSKSLKEHSSIIKLSISLPLFIIGLLSGNYPIIQIILLTTAYCISGYNVLFRAVKNIFRGKVFDEFFLMSIATIGAFIVGEYAEGVGVMIFFQFGEFFQDLAVGKTKKSIKSLMSIKPDFARRDNGDMVQPEDIQVKEIIEVRPGEKVPLDGIIISGNTTMDTKTITGESVPRYGGIKDEVLSGFVNISDIIKIEVTKVFKESTISKILEMVQNESSKKTTTEKFITKFSRVYTPIVVVTALIIALISPLIFSGWTYNESIYKSLIFLVISCPCALVISVPLGYFGGIGRASKEGILIKGSSHLEALNSVTKYAFDKTGTLTKGLFTVKDISVSSGFSQNELLEAAFRIESRSNHPIAVAITNFIENKQNIDPLKYREISGMGIIADYADGTYMGGKKDFLTDNGVEIEHIEDTFGTKVYISRDGSYLGVLTLADSIKEDAKELVNKLGVDNVYMLTGDNSDAAEFYALELGIKNVKSSLLPLNKAEFIKDLSKTEKVMFIGDGINDAPVLAASHVGVSMGGIGSDAAIEASDIVIMTDEPSKVISAVKIAKYTRKIIIQNITIALVFKIIIMILGLTGLAGLWLAIFADVGVGLLAVLNSIRTLNYKID